MQKNDLIEINDTIYRVLDLTEDKALIIDCLKRNMPKWVGLDYITDYQPATIEVLQDRANIKIYDFENAPQPIQRTIREHFTLIAGVLPFVSDGKERSRAINHIAEQYNVSKPTIRNYLCLYLAFQNMSVLAPYEVGEKELTEDEKIIRWALNKFFYTKHKNSLMTAYTYMLKEKYCDSTGQLCEHFPTFNQFRYFYRKTKNYQKYYISREGLKGYQKNYRPLLGDGVQEYAPAVGVGMLDATICDIYLVNEDGGVVGRPILTACIDAYSSMCMGYSLTWEGGVYSLKDLMLNVVSDKVELCRKYGIEIGQTDWDCTELPSTIVTDMGREYTSFNFEQIAELGIKVINLPAYRPELKGSVEKFFDLLQNTYKDSLKGKGVIEDDFQERGGHDYRKDACLTLKEFEKIILRCIIFYNTKRLIENYPYTEDMISSEVKPYANAIWNYGKEQVGANLIPMDADYLIKVLLPRAEGRFTRQGLKVNGLRYENALYTEKYLAGGVVDVAYNPEDASRVWLIENGKFVDFRLIESRYDGKSFGEVQALKNQQKSIIEHHSKETLQGKIDLLQHIETIAEVGRVKPNADIQQIRKNKQKAISQAHKDYTKGV